MQVETDSADLYQLFWQQLFNRPIVGIVIFFLVGLTWGLFQCKQIFSKSRKTKETIQQPKSIKRLSSIEEDKNKKEQFKQEFYRQQIILGLQEKDNKSKKQDQRRLKSKEGINKNPLAFMQQKAIKLIQMRQTNSRLCQAQKQIATIQNQENKILNKKKAQSKTDKQTNQNAQGQRRKNFIFDTFGPKIQQKQYNSNNMNQELSNKISLQNKQSMRSGENTIFQIKKDKINDNNLGTSQQLFPNNNIQIINKAPENNSLFQNLASKNFQGTNNINFMNNVNQKKQQPIPLFNPTSSGGNSLFNKNAGPNIKIQQKNTDPKDKIQSQINLQKKTLFSVNNISQSNIASHSNPKIEQNNRSSQVPQNFVQNVPTVRQIKLETTQNNRNNPSIPVPVVPRPKTKLISQELLQSYIAFVDKLKEEVPISSKMQNLLGARSSPNDILIQAKSLIGTIDKNDDKQLTTFGLRLFDTIVYKFINNSNIKSGLQRIPPRSRTDQCEKNSINCYVLALNSYRLMNQGKKVWVIVFGKLLKLLQFLYKRKIDLQSYHKLELIQSHYIDKFKDVHSKYVSRIDFLIYMLLGMTAFDPILILRQVEQKQKSAQKSRAEVQSWGNLWSYNQFWSLVSVIMSNKHESYSKPIFYMNLLYVLYPRIYEYKVNPANFRRESELFMIVLEKSGKYIKNFKKIKEVEILGQCEQTRDYNYDGYDFVKSILSLDTRINQKVTEINMNAKNFETKANIFYYFTKEK